MWGNHLLFTLGCFVECMQRVEHGWKVAYTGMKRTNVNHIIQNNCIACMWIHSSFFIRLCSIVTVWGGFVSHLYMGLSLPPWVQIGTIWWNYSWKRLQEKLSNHLGAPYCFRVRLFFKDIASEFIFAVSVYIGFGCLKKSELLHFQYNKAILERSILV